MLRERVPQTDDVSYREYLVEVLRQATSKPPSEFTPATPKDQTWLAGRFKQSFTTTDNNVIGANVVACEVMAKVLVEDLGLLPGALPAQGSAAARSHLDALIAASGNTRDQLETVYCIDLGRSDLATTTRVRENIRTLQQFLADGPIDGLGSGYLPFFLYKEEWRLQKRTPFFPENHRRLMVGAFTTAADRRRADALVAAVKSFSYQPDPAKPAKVKLVADSDVRAFLGRVVQLLHVDTKLMEGHRHLRDQQYRLADNAYSGAARLIETVTASLGFNGWTADADGSNAVDLDTTIALTTAEAFRSSLDPAKALGASTHVFWGSSKYTLFPPNEWPKAWSLYRDSAAWKRVDVKAGLVPVGMPYTEHLFDELARRYDQRATKPVRSLIELSALEDLTSISMTSDPTKLSKRDELKTALVHLHDELLSLVVHQYFFQIPLCRAEVAHQLGDYPLAAERLASVFEEDLMRGTLATETPTKHLAASVADGDLPWGWDTFGVAGVGRDYPYLNRDADRALVQLRFGALYLEWADALYRTDEFAEVQRARKLYEAVLRIYGLDPTPDAKLDPLPVRVKRPPRTVLDDRIGPRPDLSDVRLTTVSTGATGAVGASPATPTPGFPVHRHGRGAAAVDTLEAQPATAAAAALTHDATIDTMKHTPAEAFAPSGLIDRGVFVDAGPATLELIQPVETVADTFGVIDWVVLAFNPAILAQQQRARLALAQIAAGANYFGYRDDVVPLLRYRPLATVAHRYATSAEQAEADAIRFTNEAAKAELGLLKARTALSTTAARVAVESERIVKADDERQAAELQVKRVKAAIKAKRDEIADHSDICGQIGDWFDGITDFFSSDVPDKVGKYVKSDASAALGLSEATAGATAGLGVVGGMALWGIGNAITLSGMADEANARVAALKRLEEQDLFLANLALDARKRELAVAQGQKVIAQLEAQLAQEVYRYSVLRFLNQDAWNQMAITMRSVLRRYLELGAMTGWLAERALAYEQDRTLNVMRLDYYQPDRKGLLGSARLQADLALLESEFVTGFDATVPITWTISLARQHPLQFGQLKATGTCTFGTTSADLRLAFPGSFSHRIRALDIATLQPVTNAPPRGVLRNSGISGLISADGSAHHLARRPDTFPLSEFRLVADHLAIFELPDIGLMPFEGSGFDTSWRLELPAAANPGGLESLLDVCITFHLTTEFASSTGPSPTPEIRRTALLSAANMAADAWADLRSSGKPVGFDVTDDHLVAGTGHRVTNVGVFLVGTELPDIEASLEVGEADPIEFTIADGVAHSTQVTPPTVVPGAGTADLDALFERGDVAPVGRWTIDLKVAEEQPELTDLWLGIEYAVTVSG